jgi:hypothetical protein
MQDAAWPAPKCIELRAAEKEIFPIGAGAVR